MSREATIEEIYNGFIVSDTSTDLDVSMRKKIYCKTIEEAYLTLNDIFDIFAL